MEKVLSEANSKNINNFKQILVSLGRGIEKNYGIVDSRMQQNATQNGVLKSYKVITCKLL